MFHRLSILTVSFIVLAICGAVAEARPPKSVTTKVSFSFPNADGVVNATFRATPTSSGEFLIAVSIQPKNFHGTNCLFGGDCFSWRVRGTATGETTVAPDVFTTLICSGCYVVDYSTGTTSEIAAYCEFTVDAEGKVTVHVLSIGGLG